MIALMLCIPGASNQRINPKMVSKKKFIAPYSGAINPEKQCYEDIRKKVPYSGTLLIRSHLGSSQRLINSEDRKRQMIMRKTSGGKLCGKLQPPACQINPENQS